MPLLYNADIAMGEDLPQFSIAFEGQSYTNTNSMGENGLLVAFVCNHCPYVIEIWSRFLQLDAVAKASGVNILAINSNINDKYPQDSVANMKIKAQQDKMQFAYIADESQQVARDFNAVCTPDFFLYDANAKLVYHGALDDSASNADAVTVQYIADAMQSLKTKNSVKAATMKSQGCSIKWRN